MAKFNLSKKTAIKKKVLICILYHDKNCDLAVLFKKLNLEKDFEFLIILDGVEKIKNQKKILKKIKNIKILKAKKVKNSLPFNRNRAIKFLKEKHFLLIFLDSDIQPTKNLIVNHLNFHLKKREIAVAGGEVIPSFKMKVKSFWEILDGCMSWFTSIYYGKNRIISFPYHLPTCNMSIKSNLFRSKILFDENLATGEDANFCDDVRKAGKKIELISDAKIYHKDRVKFFDFFNHQLKWGTHQYYTLYKKKFFRKSYDKIFYIFFIIFFPFLMPITNMIYALLITLPWIKKNYLFTLIFPFVTIVYFLKGVMTYRESFFDFKKNFFN
jgi:hypothetical protein